MTDTPLAGLRVVSMAEQYPGPLATMFLADLGAEVILVERPGVGDPARLFPPFFEALNRGKRAVTADARTPEGRARVVALAADADVFFDGFRPGKLAKLGLGYEDLSSANRGLVYVSISGFGQDSPYRDRASHDLGYQGVAGWLADKIAAGDDTACEMTHADVTAALWAVTAALTGLQARQRTGRGCHADLAMADGLLSLVAAPLAMAANGHGSWDGPMAEPAYDMFNCADNRRLTLSIAHEDAFWTRLCEALELDDMASWSRADRVARRGEANDRLRAVFATRPRDAWIAHLWEADVTALPAHEAHEVRSDRHVAARGLFETYAGADGAPTWAVRQPVRYSGYDNAPLTPAPGLGEDNDTLGRAADVRSIKDAIS